AWADVRVTAAEQVARPDWDVLVQRRSEVLPKYKGVQVDHALGICGCRPAQDQPIAQVAPVLVVRHLVGARLHYAHSNLPRRARRDLAQYGTTDLTNARIDGELDQFSEGSRRCHRARPPRTREVARGFE